VKGLPVRNLEDLIPVNNGGTPVNNGGNQGGSQGGSTGGVPSGSAGGISGGHSGYSPGVDTAASPAEVGAASSVSEEPASTLQRPMRLRMLHQAPVAVTPHGTSTVSWVSLLPLVSWPSDSSGAEQENKPQSFSFLLTIGITFS